MKEWKEISEDKTIIKLKDEMVVQAERFIYNVHHKKLPFKEKLKYGVGQKLIQKAFKKHSDEYFENAIITKGLKKTMEALNKGKTVEFDKFFMKKENDKFFIKSKPKI